ncbi:hypothetical protein RQP46_008904 [Phenoliferia psychrophenolica]
MSTEVLCAVCTAPGTLQCSRCRSIRFCGAEHQKLLWTSHKLICKPNAPLVFAGRRLEDSELSAQLTITPGKLSKYRYLSTDPNISAADLLTLAVEDTKSWMKTCTPEVRDLFATCNSAGNALLQSPPHAAWVYANLILHEPMVEGDKTLRPVLAKLKPEDRNRIELQALVLGALVANDTSQDLIELAVQRLMDMSEPFDVIENWGYRVRICVKMLKDYRSGYKPSA